MRHLATDSNSSMLYHDDDHKAEIRHHTRRIRLLMWIVVALIISTSLAARAVYLYGQEVRRADAVARG